jgi:hypothetical protein
MTFTATAGRESDVGIATGSARNAIPARPQNPSQVVAVPNPTRVATSTAERPHDVYSRIRTDPPLNMAKPTLWLRAVAVNDASPMR